MLKKLALIISLAVLISGCSNQNLSKTEHFKKGLSFLENGNPNGAILSFKSAIEKDENYFEARYQLALAYISQNKYESAEKELKKALMLNPSFSEARVVLAKTYLNLEKPLQALEEINVYMQTEKNNSEAYELAGAAYAAKSDYATAK